MIAIFDDRQLGHRPAHEFFNGALTAHADTPARAANVLAAIGGTTAPVDHGMAALVAVHDPAYLAFLAQAHDRWLAAGRTGDAIGYAWPVVGRRPLDLSRIDALLGRFTADAVTPIDAGTWDAAYWGAQSALTALDHVLAGAVAAFALCRPPGHHAGRDYAGGYCFLNNAAIVAQAAVDAGRRVAILDVDYHHGNGTQDIFYDRGDMAFVSIHADPGTDFPYFWGHADETGAGAGVGANHNIVLPRGTDWTDYAPRLDDALATVAAHAADLLILSFGADTFEGDPIAGFTLTTADFATMGRRIAATAPSTVIVMEGGYAVDALGANVAALLAGFEDARQTVDG
ncbi:histone deacetylase family protein [Sphingomonas montana]|uniref:histone deacetylase family protein n=1 Tax=Sphingomonas montana TaxID=1843236 RepID=UPI00096E5373|nr:histone deacetylase family protein [Sphingomonas montana]